MAQMKVETVRPELVAVLRRTAASGEVGAAVAEACAAAVDAVARAGGAVGGAPFAWYLEPPSEAADVEVAAGYPVTGLAPGELEGQVVVVERPGGLAAVALHEGPYDDMGHTYRELEVWLRGRALDVGDDSWEEYLGDADGAPQVRIVWPLV